MNNKISLSKHLRTFQVKSLLLLVILVTLSENIVYTQAFTITSTHFLKTRTYFIRSVYSNTIKYQYLNNRKDHQVINSKVENTTLLIEDEIQENNSGNQITVATVEPALLSILLLNVVTVIWGTQHAIIKQVLMDEVTPTSAFTLARFLLGLLLVCRYTPTIVPKSDEDILPWRWGAELGLWMFLGYAFQAIGLEYTTAQRSGFLLYLNVKFVPFFAFLLLGRTISLPTWLSALTALLGTYLLSNDGTPVNVGDIWSLAAAAASAMFILRLENASKIPSINSSSLNAACLWTVTIASSLWCIYDNSSPLDVIQSHFLAILYLGGVTTALANYIQTKAQKDISAERASIIYAMDPVYGAAFSYLILDETLGFQGFIGAFLISCAAIANAVLDFGEKDDEIL